MFDSLIKGILLCVIAKIVFLARQILIQTPIGVIKLSGNLSITRSYLIKNEKFCLTLYSKVFSAIMQHHGKQIFKMSNTLYVAAANLILKKKWDELEERRTVYSNENDIFIQQ